MNEIHLNDLNLKTFTGQDISDYCFINNINPDNITYLSLGYNKITDISGIKLFKNLKQLYLTYNNITDITYLKNLTELEELYLGYNKIKDISVIKDLKNLKELDIDNLKLESDQIQYIKSLKNLKKLYSVNGFKDMSVSDKLNKNIIISYE